MFQWPHVSICWSKGFRSKQLLRKLMFFPGEGGVLGLSFRDTLYLNIYSIYICIYKKMYILQQGWGRQASDEQSFQWAVCEMRFFFMQIHKGRLGLGHFGLLHQVLARHCSHKKFGNTTFTSSQGQNYSNLLSTNLWVRSEFCCTIIFRLMKLQKATFFMLCTVILLVRLQEKLNLITLGSERVQLTLFTAQF